VSGAIHRFEGQVMTCLPGHGPCYRCLYAEVPAGLVPSCADAGVLGVLPAVIGAIQATEAIKLIVGAGELLTGRLLVYDALEMAFREFTFERRRDCAVCGDRPTITKPQQSLGEACDAATVAARVRHLRPAELQAELRLASSAAGAIGPLLVDVREPREFAVGHLEGAVNIPLAELAGRMQEIPADRSSVYMCRSGGRSLTACGIALRSGANVAGNLDGGLLAWAAEIDPSLEVAPVR
jgi:adenylyltransferase/sulfurtransferase